MNWTSMIPAQFDKSQVADKKTREFIETAGSTMFPELLPQVKPAHTRSAAPQPMPGEVPMFEMGCE